MVVSSRWYTCLTAALAATACGGSSRSLGEREPTGPAGAWHEVRFRSAALSARRSNGAPWHAGSVDTSSALFGGLLGLAIGYPEVGVLLGASLQAEPQPTAPAPFVVVKIAGDTYRIEPVGQTLAPAWTQPIAVPTGRYRGDVPVLVQILDAVDSGVLGQKRMTVDELLAPGARTLSELGEVASLDFEARAMPPRPSTSFELYVDGQLSLKALRRGNDARWLPIPVWNGDRVTVAAGGEICPSRAAPCFGPAGAEPGRWRSYNYDLFSDAAHASLVGLLPGRAVEIGEHASIIAEESGYLLLFVNDEDTGNNTGGFDVAVTVEPARL